MDLHLHLRVAGAILVVIGVGHVFLPTALAWRQEFAAVSPLTREIAYVHSAYIGMVCVLFGLPAALVPAVLVGGAELSRLVLIGYITFWASRLFVQLFVFSREHWRGDRARTLTHVAFVALWTYQSAVYATAFASIA